MIMMEFKLNLFALVFLMTICSSSSSSISDVNKLAKDLNVGYNKMVRGNSDLSQPSVVYFSFRIIRISEYEEVSGKLSVVGHFFFYWVDERMKWNSSLYNDTDSILYEENEVWKPLLVLVTTQEELKKIGGDSFFIRYFSSGVAEWVPGDIYKSSCTPDIFRYPFDKQTCTLLFVAWGYSLTEITLVPTRGDVDTRIYTEHGIWDLDNTTVGSYKDENRGFQALSLTLSMSRRSSFYVINMILPIVVMGFLNMFVFILPQESGERVGYSITVLLAIAVFQTIAADNLPNVSSPRISVLCVKLLIDLIASAVVTIFTVLSLFLSSISEKRNVPVCLAVLCRIILCRCCKSIKRNDDTCTSPDVLSVSDQRNGLTSTEITLTEDDAVTWYDVGKASDIVFGCFSFITFIATNITFIIFIIYE